MLNTVVFLGLRVLHVLAAAIWIGSAAFLALVVVPSIEASGPAGGQVMTLVTSRNGRHFGVFSGLTLLSGIYLLWRFTGGFDGAVLSTHAGRAFSIGGAAGILAFIVGIIIGRTAERLVATGASLGAAGDDAARRTLVQQVGALRARLKTLTTTVILLQAVALVLMAVGHYI